MTAFVNFGQTDGFGVPGRENDRAGRSREIFASDGKVIKLEARDPYGHWFVVWPKGSAPNTLSGAYTSAMEATNAVMQYLATETYNTKLVDEPVKIPELARKKN